jgi:signal transduction histidine kinase
MRWSIRYQLLVPLLALLLGVVVGITAWSSMAAMRRERRQIDAQARSMAVTLINLNYPLHEYTLRRVRGLNGAEFVVVGAPRRGAEQARMRRPTYTTLLPDFQEFEPPALETIVDSPEDLTLETHVTFANRRFLCGAVRIHEEMNINQGSVFYILYPESLWRDRLWDALLPSLVIGTIGIVAAVAGALALAHQLGRRIREIDRRTRLIAAGDFSPMPLPRRSDELRDLTQGVNEMAARLAQLQDTIKLTERVRLLGQVGSGLAHQLRNCVTGARLAMQIHARECPGDAEPLQVALRQLDLLEANLKRFLDLGREDAPGSSRQLCFLTALINEAVLLLQPQCRHARIDLRRQPGEEIALSGDPEQLGHLLHNVLGNAVEAAGPGGWVEVRAWCEAKPAGDGMPAQAVVEVSDSGPGPAAEVADRLFEPFVTGKREGIGLGLAVARRVAESHGGSLAWRREADRTCFRIELPLGQVAARAIQDSVVSVTTDR